MSETIQFKQSCQGGNIDVDSRWTVDKVVALFDLPFNLFGTNSPPLAAFVRLEG